MKFTNRSRFNVAVLPLIALLVLLSTGRVLHSIHSTINEEVYHNSRGKVEKVTPEDWDLPYQDVSFKTRDGLTIKGWFIDNEKTSQVIIFAPGRGGSRWNILRNAPIEYVYERNFDILLFDPRSTGKSEGEKYGYGYFEAKDIVHAVEFLKEKKEATSIGVWGGSAGASAAIMAGLETPEIDAIVADSPYASLRIAVSNFGEKKEVKLTEALFPLYMEVAKLTLNFDIGKTNLLNRVKDLRTPCFLIHGTEDQILAPKNSQLLYESINSTKQLWLAEGAGHVESYDLFPKEYKERVTAFFKKHMPERETT